MLTNKGVGRSNIVLVNGNDIISDDTEVAQIFNNFFENCVYSLNILENKLLLTETHCIPGSAEESIKKSLEIIQVS